MARETVEKLIKRYNKAKSIQDQYRDVHEAAYEFAIPSRNLYSDKTEGSSRMNGIFDSTAMRAKSSFANNMQASITPPFKRWSNLKLGPAFDALKNNEETSDEHKKLNEILEQATSLGFSIINSSNFNSAITGYYADLAVGTGIMLTLPSLDDSKVIDFIVIPIEEVALEKGPAGTIGAKFRTQEMAVRLVKETWPDAKLTSDMQKMVEEDGSQIVTIVEMSYTEKKITYYDIIELKSNTRIVEREFNFDPWIITRIGTSPMDVYGTGPLIEATPDIRTLNISKKLIMQNAQMAIFGIYTVADNDIVNPNTLTLNPGAFIPVSRNGGPNGPSIAPLPRSGDPNSQSFFVQDLQSSIREMLLDDKLPPDTGPVRSATEIVERISNIRRTTGVFFGPINQELIQHLWQNILIIMVEKNLIPIPNELLRVDNFFVQVEILSPIAREQDFEDVQSFVQSYEIYSSIAGPEAAQLLFNIEEAGEWLAEKIGTPAHLVRSKEERESIKQQMISEQVTDQVIEGQAQQQLQQQI